MDCQIHSTALTIRWLLTDTFSNRPANVQTLETLRVLCVERLSNHFTCPDACIEQRVDAFLRTASSLDTPQKMARQEGEP